MTAPLFPSPSLVWEVSAADRAASKSVGAVLRTRIATLAEKTAAGAAPADLAQVLVITTCRGTFGVVVVERALACDVNEAARTISRLNRRPFAEATIAATFFPMLGTQSLLELARLLMGLRSHCRSCECGAGYAGIVAALADAAAKANGRPWSIQALESGFEAAKTALPQGKAHPSITEPNVVALAEAARTVIRAGGYAP